MEEYSTIDVCKILDIHRQRLREWLPYFMDTIPSIQKAEGTGTKNLFSRWDIYAIEIYLRLVETGRNRFQANTFIHRWISETKSVPLDERNKIKYIVMYFATLDNKEIGMGEGKGILSNSRIIRTDDKEFDISEIEFDRRAKLVSWEYIDVQSIMTYVDERIG